MLKKETVMKYLNPLSPIPSGVSSGGKLRHPVHCILFDVYGTLFISGSGDIQTTREQTYSQTVLDQLLFKFGIQERSRMVLADFYHAIEEKHRQLKNRGIDVPEVEIDRIWMDILKLNDRELARDFAVEFELIINPVYPMPHLTNLISACKRSNMKMGIISNAQFFTPYLFNWFLGADPESLGFDGELLFYSYQFGYGKPSQYLFQKAYEKLNEKGIFPDAGLYVGNDMLNDIYPAQQIGFQTALFAGDKRSLRLREDDPRCREVSPDLVITDLSQLVDILKIDQ